MSDDREDKDGGTWSDGGKSYDPPVRKVIQRPADDGSFDELILKDANCHFEMLDKNQLWVGVDAGGKRYAMVITARGKLDISFREE